MKVEEESSSVYVENESDTEYELSRLDKSKVRWSRAREESSFNLASLYKNVEKFKRDLQDGEATSSEILLDLRTQRSKHGTQRNGSLLAKHITRKHPLL